MKFTQSRFQDIFSRSYEMICNTIWSFIFALLFYFLFSAEINLFSYLLISLTILFGSICYSLYKHKEGSKVIHLTEDSFIYRDGETVKEFGWEEYQGYKISRVLPYQIVIKNRKYGKTKFSYYAFSLSQRKKIFEVLQSCRLRINRSDPN